MRSQETAGLRAGQRLYSIGTLANLSRNGEMMQQGDVSSISECCLNGQDSAEDGVIAILKSFGKERAMSGVAASLHQLPDLGEGGKGVLCPQAQRSQMAPQKMARAP